MKQAHGPSSESGSTALPRRTARTLVSQRKRRTTTQGTSETSTKGTGPDTTTAPPLFLEHLDEWLLGKLSAIYGKHSPPETPLTLSRTLVRRADYLEAIVRVTASAFGTTVRDLRSKSKPHSLVMPRMYANQCLRIAGLGPTERGRILNRDHSTMIYWDKQWRQWTKEQPWSERVAEEILNSAAVIAGYNRVKGIFNDRPQ